MMKYNNNIENMNLKRARNLLATLLILAGVARITGRPYLEKVLTENGLTATDKEESGIVKFTKYPPESFEYKVGSIAKIECEAIGSSDLSVQWVPGNTAEADFINNYTPSPATIVKIRSVLVIEHLKEVETFSCIATSLHTGKQIIAKTKIIPKMNTSENEFDEIITRKHNSKSPKIILNYSLFMTTIGSNIILPCQTAHNTPHHHAIKKYWIDFNNNILNDDNPKFNVNHNGDLVISDLEWKDMGAYKCIVENSHGSDSAKTFVYPVLDD